MIHPFITVLVRIWMKSLHSLVHWCHLNDKQKHRRKKVIILIAQGGHYWNFRNHVRLKIGSIKFIEGKNYNFVRSTIALEICPNMIICNIGWRIIPPL